MSNKFGIPESELARVRDRDKSCVYCGKVMIFPYVATHHADSATIEHLNFDGPFYWWEGLQIQDIVICCGGCNSSRGVKRLGDWFKTSYCISRNINEETVALPIKHYLKRKE